MRALVGETFRLLGGHLDLFTLIVLTVWLPGAVLTNYLEFFNPGGEGPGRALRAALLVEALFGPLVGSAVVVALARIKRGLPVGYGIAMSEGLAAWWRLFVVRLVVGLIVVLGFLALVVPGLVLLVRYALVDSVTVLEGAGVTGARRRSTELTEGRRREIFWTGALLLGIVMGFGLLLSLPLALAPALDHFVVRVLRDCMVAVAHTLFTIAFFLFYWRSTGGGAVTLPGASA